MASVKSNNFSVIDEIQQCNPRLQWKAEECIVVTNNVLFLSSSSHEQEMQDLTWAFLKQKKICKKLTRSYVVFLNPFLKTSRGLEARQMFLSSSHLFIPIATNLSLSPEHYIIDTQKLTKLSYYTKHLILTNRHTFRWYQFICICQVKKNIFFNNLVLFDWWDGLKSQSNQQKKCSDDDKPNIAEEEF
ncbi:hypothetical protein RFI_00426, partial [Reticulomyxa filosa]